MADGTCEVDLFIHHVKGGAVLLSDDGVKSNAVWVPLSQIVDTRSDIVGAIGQTKTIEMQEWIANDRGFI